ncbi:6271_t:CDS:2 [Entrophospora sp. SA101]|nr:874_t:CDS:2 [Entrophospora sp. SA101]CAJ0636327.1 6271_t:CDS:2 [Entrophospora sp. SA101]CAJ0913629.1 19025_t:CDS:2 [Entrophospora sp. SA101]
MEAQSYINSLKEQQKIKKVDVKDCSNESTVDLELLDACVGFIIDVQVIVFNEVFGESTQSEKDYYLQILRTDRKGKTNIMD